MAVVTSSRLLESPTTTTCPSGNLAFAALRASPRLSPSRTPMRTKTCSLRPPKLAGTSSMLEAEHTGSNALFDKIALRPSRKTRLGCTTTHAIERISVYQPNEHPQSGADGDANWGERRDAHRSRGVCVWYWYQINDAPNLS